MGSEEIWHLKRLRARYVDYLRIYEQQARSLGVYDIPALLMNKIESLKREINTIDQKLQREIVNPHPESRHIVHQCFTLDRAALFNLLTRHFDEGELRTLCFLINIDYESLGGQGKRDNVRELILLCERKNRVREL